LAGSAVKASAASPASEAAICAPRRNTNDFIQTSSI
jgi:hypothetical protein